MLSRVPYYHTAQPRCADGLAAQAWGQTCSSWCSFLRSPRTLMKDYQASRRRYQRTTGHASCGTRAKAEVRTQATEARFFDHSFSTRCCERPQSARSFRSACISGRVRSVQNGITLVRQISENVVEPTCERSLESQRGGPNPIVGGRTSESSFSGDGRNGGRRERQERQPNAGAGKAITPLAHSPEPPCRNASAKQGERQRCGNRGENRKMTKGPKKRAELETKRWLKTAGGKAFLKLQRRAKRVPFRRPRWLARDLREIEEIRQDMKRAVATRKSEEAT